MTQKRARIIGTGSYLPSRILSNKDLEQMVDTSNEWIVSRTGMNERRIAAEGEFTSHMGVNAAKKALYNAQLSADKIDCILVATMTPDFLCPSTAAIIQFELKATKAAAVDFQAACTGFIYGLSLAKAYVESGMYQNILVIASEKLSSYIDYTDRNTCVLFGDGASAAVISHEGKGLAIDTICLGADGELSDLVIIPGGGTRHPASEDSLLKRLHYIQMSGKEVFRHAVKRMAQAAVECLEKAQLKDEDILWMVPHQANLRIISATAKELQIPDEKIYVTVHKYGNTSASSVAIALDELLQEKKLEKNQHLLLVAFGGGLTWGASVLTQL